MFNPTLNPIFLYQFKNNTAQCLESTPSSALYPLSMFSLLDTSFSSESEWLWVSLCGGVSWECHESGCEVANVQSVEAHPPRISATLWHIYSLHYATIFLHFTDCCYWFPVPGPGVYCGSVFACGAECIQWSVSLPYDRVTAHTTNCPHQPNPRLPDQYPRHLPEPPSVAQTCRRPQLWLSLRWLTTASLFARIIFQRSYC